ncbi:hypothetical protein CLF_112079 [Clonorchis sinensis]|uniref:Uncharacterized protein n=1 Tax=Clonorchis sinensis TaxID=79923 RepID=G7YVT3_CLOSI|nr:hypothetical protein CLF_112079 [Clonorchis sinensis]
MRVRANRKVWWTQKAKEMEEAQKACNARRLFRLIRPTISRKPFVSKTIEDRVRRIKSDFHYSCIQDGKRKDMQTGGLTGLPNQTIYRFDETAFTSRPVTLRAGGKHQVKSMCTVSIRVSRACDNRNVTDLHKQCDNHCSQNSKTGCHQNTRKVAENSSTPYDTWGSSSWNVEEFSATIWKNVPRIHKYFAGRVERHYPGQVYVDLFAESDNYRMCIFGQEENFCTTVRISGHEFVLLLLFSSVLSNPAAGMAAFRGRITVPLKRGQRGNGDFRLSLGFPSNAPNKKIPPDNRVICVEISCRPIHHTSPFDRTVVVFHHLCLKKLNKEVHELTKYYKSIESGEVFSVTFGMIMTMKNNILKRNLDMTENIILRTYSSIALYNKDGCRCHYRSKLTDVPPKVTRFPIRPGATLKLPVVVPQGIEYFVIRSRNTKDNSDQLDELRYAASTAGLTEYIGDSYAIQYPAPCCKKGYIGEGVQDCPQVFTEVNSNYLRGCNEGLHNSLRKPVMMAALGSLVIPIFATKKDTSSIGTLSKYLRTQEQNRSKKLRRRDTPRKNRSINTSTLTQSISCYEEENYTVTGL